MHSRWHALNFLTRPYRGQMALIALFALLATATDLMSPLIYREAVNDIAGLFVASPTDNAAAKFEEDSAVWIQSGDDAVDTGSANTSYANPDRIDKIGADIDSPADSAYAAEHGESSDVLESGDGGNDGQSVGPTLESAVDVVEPAVGKQAQGHHSARREPHHKHSLAHRTAQQAFKTLMWSVAVLFAIHVFSHYCSLVADQKTVRLASSVEGSVIQDTFRHVLSLPLRFFSRKSSGGLAKQIDQSDQIAPIITAVAHEIAPAVISMVGVLVIMLTQSWKLSLVALVTLPPYAWIVLRSSKRLEKGLTEYYDMWDGVSSSIQDALGAVKTVKLSGAEAREAEKLRRQSNAAYATYVERNRLANRYIFWQTSLNYLSQALVLGYGGWLVFQHRLTPGDVVMFVAYLDRLYTPIESLTGVSVTLQEHFVSLKRALKLLATPGEEARGEPLRPGPGHVEFHGLRFGYVTGRDVLHDVSFTLEPGKITALVGPSGAGKTTVADLLLKLFDYEAGQILLDGQSLQKLDAAALRRDISVVAADGAIFRGTIVDNIRYKRPEASLEEVQGAALAAGLKNMLERMPQGLDTEIGERGVGLSVGERQRLQIARALVAQPRILILDEATSNLDYATESDIRTALLQRPNPPTTLVITHRYAMAENCDRAVVLQAGRVIDQGRPAELIERCEWFRRFASDSASPANAPPEVP